MSDFFAKRGDAAGGAVAIASCGDRIAERIHNGRSGMKIGFAEFEMNDGTTLAFQFLGASKYSQRAFSG